MLSGLRPSGMKPELGNRRRVEGAMVDMVVFRGLEEVKYGAVFRARGTEKWRQLKGEERGGE